MPISNNFNPFLLITMSQKVLNLHVLHFGYQNSSARTQTSLRMAHIGPKRIREYVTVVIRFKYLSAVSTFGAVV